MALSAIHILASYGADVNAVDSCGMTPLHMATGILHKDIITSLIKEGADVNMVCVVLLLFFFFFLVVGFCGMISCSIFHNNAKPTPTWVFDET